MADSNSLLRARSRYRRAEMTLARTGLLSLRGTGDKIAGGTGALGSRQSQITSRATRGGDRTENLPLWRVQKARVRYTARYAVLKTALQQRNIPRSGVTGVTYAMSGLLPYVVGIWFAMSGGCHLSVRCLELLFCRRRKLPLHAYLCYGRHLLKRLRPRLLRFHFRSCSAVSFLMNPATDTARHPAITFAIANSNSQYLYFDYGSLQTLGTHSEVYHFTPSEVATLTITATAPEPSSWALMILPVIGIGICYRTSSRVKERIPPFPADHPLARAGADQATAALRRFNEDLINRIE